MNAVGGQRLEDRAGSLGSGPPLDFANVVEAHGTVLRARALWLTKSESDAADLFQDTIERALSAARRPLEPDLVRRWLFTIMHNVFLDHKRGFGVRKRVAWSQAVVERTPASEPELVAEWRLVDDELLWSCIDSLPRTLRAIFRRWLEDVSYEQLAADFNIPLGTVASRLLRSRRRLRALLTSAIHDQRIQSGNLSRTQQ